MRKKRKKGETDLNYLDLIPRRNEALRWHRDLKERVILKIENTGIMNTIAQKVFGKPRFTKVHLAPDRRRENSGGYRGAGEGGVRRKGRASLPQDREIFSDCGKLQFHRVYQ